MASKKCMALYCAIWLICAESSFSAEVNGNALKEGETIHSGISIVLTTISAAPAMSITSLALLAFSVSFLLIGKRNRKLRSSIIGVMAIGIAVVSYAFASYLAATDAEGYYSLSNIPVGSYHLEASAEGYYPAQIESLDIHDGINVIQDVTLHPIATPTSTPTPAGTPGDVHQSIQSYEGPQTCIVCHADEAQDAAQSEHLQWAGKWTHVNTYCTAPEPADYACLSCHASTGKISSPTASDVDCLVCHNNVYQRSLGPLTVPVHVVDWMGNSKTYWTPEKNAQGEYEFLPRFDLMPAGTTMVDLARTVHLPNRSACLRCHAKAGGSDGAKRGDISSANAAPAYASDIHMSPSGADLLCQDCHTTSNHHISGRGVDLRIEEGQTPRCADCHTSAPHDDDRRDTHAQRVACQTCHIPTYGKDVSTELSRDWTNPVWNPNGCNGQGAWIGEEIRGSNVVPSYTFWNGTNFVYNLNDSIAPDPDGRYTMAKALGSIQDGKLFPIKVHESRQPRHNDTGRMVQYEVLWNFMTGFYEEAAARGVEFMGLTGDYAWVDARAQQLITHGVAPASQAVSCSACHVSHTQMTPANLGYILKGPENQVCIQCHDQEEKPGFYDLHNKHVTDKEYDCSWCHAFNRPERGLTMPPG